MLIPVLQNTNSFFKTPDVKSPFSCFNIYQHLINHHYAFVIFFSLVFLMKIKFYGRLCCTLRIVHTLSLLESIDFEKMCFHAENSSCLMSDVYIEICSHLASLGLFFILLFAVLQPCGWMGCHEKCKVCVNHVTAGQPIITEHFLFL